MPAPPTAAPSWPSGVVVPTPTVPSALTRNASLLPVFTTRGRAFLVPRKSVAVTVLPLRSQGMVHAPFDRTTVYELSHHWCRAHRLRFDHGRRVERFAETRLRVLECRPFKVAGTSYRFSRSCARAPS